MKSLSDVKKDLSNMLVQRGDFQMDVEQAKRHGLCAKCGQKAEPRCYSNAGRREYQLSGICERCFDSMFGPTEVSQ